MRNAAGHRGVGGGSAPSSRTREVSERGRAPPESAAASLSLVRVRVSVCVRMSYVRVRECAASLGWHHWRRRARAAAPKSRNPCQNLV